MAARDLEREVGIRYDFGRCCDESSSNAYWPAAGSSDSATLFDVTEYAPRSTRCECTYAIAAFISHHNKSVHVKLFCAACGRVRRGWWNGDWFPKFDFLQGGWFEHAVPYAIARSGFAEEGLKGYRDELLPAVRDAYKQYLEQNDPKCFDCGSPVADFDVARAPDLGLEWLRKYRPAAYTSIVHSMPNSTTFSWFDDLKPSQRNRVIQIFKSSGIELDHVYDLSTTNAIQVDFPRTVAPKTMYAARRELALARCKRCHARKRQEPLESLTRLTAMVGEFQDAMDPLKTARLLAVAESLYPYVVEVDAKLRLKRQRSA